MSALPHNAFLFYNLSQKINLDLAHSSIQIESGTSPQYMSIFDRVAIPPEEIGLF